MHLLVGGGLPSASASHGRTTTTLSWRPDASRTVEEFPTACHCKVLVGSKQDRTMGRLTRRATPPGPQNGSGAGPQPNNHGSRLLTLPDEPFFVMLRTGINSLRNSAPREESDIFSHRPPFRVSRISLFLLSNINTHLGDVKWTGLPVKAFAGWRRARTDTRGLASQVYTFLKGPHLSRSGAYPAMMPHDTCRYARGDTSASGF